MRKIKKKGVIDVRELGAQEVIQLIGMGVAVTCRELAEIDPNQWYGIYLQKLAQLAGANDMLLAVLRTMVEKDFDFTVTIPDDIRVVAIPNPFFDQDSEEPPPNDEGSAASSDYGYTSLDDIPF